MFEYLQCDKPCTKINFFLQGTLISEIHCAKYQEKVMCRDVCQRTMGRSCFGA